jgi:hypothetical protein
MNNKQELRRYASVGLSEVLLGTDSDRMRSILRLFENQLRNRGFAGDAIRFVSAGCVGVIVPKEPCVVPGDAKEQPFEFIEDQWPEALGFRVICDTDILRVESDHFSIRPMFFSRDKKNEYIGSSLQWVAAAAEKKADPVHAAEMMLVTFNLDDRTLVRGVHRMNPGQQWVKQGANLSSIDERQVGIATVGPVIKDCVGTEATELLSGPAERVADLMREGACIELSGGMDSRCNLALGNWRGATPKFAFTLGEEGDEEVEIAREICRRSKVEHRRIDVRINVDALDSDTDQYLESASYQVNAASYCWMPELFRELAPSREIQLCGQMASTGFFYTPFDSLAKFDSVIKRWVRARLVISGNRIADIYGDELAQVGLKTVVDSSKELLERSGGSFRDRTDEFFIYQRNRQWAGIVAHAARYWYRNQVPLLDRRVAEWAWRGQMSDRSFRLNQMKLCESLGNVLAGVPFDGGFACPANWRDKAKLELKVLGKIAGGVRRRLSRSRRNPDTGASEVSGCLARLPDTRELIVALLNGFGIAEAERRAELVCENPDVFERELGFLVTVTRLNKKISGIISDLDIEMKQVGVVVA